MIGLSAIVKKAKEVQWFFFPITIALRYHRRLGGRADPTREPNSDRVYDGPCERNTMQKCSVLVFLNIEVYLLYMLSYSLSCSFELNSQRSGVSAILRALIS